MPDAGAPSSTAHADGAKALARMRLWAGTLLAAMAALYVIAVVNQAASPLWGYAKAFAEAAMVGGLADWFAAVLS